ncbi:MAG: 1,4-dihydroxy-6-naphthoate synthase, partial [Planctomycetota bacterium]
LSEEIEVQHVIFSEIMPALQTGQADLGICIHEGRFTWEEQGLRKLEDLGESWQARTSSALPLGGIFARKRLAPQVTAEVERAIRASIAYARKNPQAALVSMRKYAQEQSDEVLLAHVDLYVNEHTHDLGEVGVRAIATLQEEARRAGALPADGPLLEIFPGYSPECAP